jgi:hypothetical protein
LPGLVEADDDGLYVLKFRGAGQGPRALVAEVLASELARLLGLPTPELVLAALDPAIGRAEPDAEIQDLLRASVGLNLGVDFLPGSLPYSPAAGPPPPPDLAADVVWLDALVTNVDRTPQNPNLLVWHDRLWLIDHGAALFFHHDPEQARRTPGFERTPFPAIRDHVLLPAAGSIRDADARLAVRVDEAALATIAEAVPDDWLGPVSRDDYVEYLCRRLEEPRAFVEEAERARGHA